MNPSVSEFAKCPVCQARFRGVTGCSRCGADLTPLMLLLARAYSLRQAARQGLQEGNGHAALAAATAAQKLHATADGNLLKTICAAIVLQEDSRVRGVDLHHL